MSQCQVSQCQVSQCQVSQCQVSPVCLSMLSALTCLCSCNVRTSEKPALLDKREKVQQTTVCRDAAGE